MKLLKTSFRALYKFRLYTIVNILGLAISLACVIFIAGYVHQETTVNSFVPELDQVYFMTVEKQNTPPRLASTANFNRAGYIDPLKDPSVKSYSRLIPFVDDHIIANDNQFITNVLAADSLFTQIITYPILHGTDILSSPDDVIITSSFARRVFGNNNPVGEKITHSSGKILTIIGVLGVHQYKSGFNFDVIVNYHLHEHWMRTACDIVKLHPGADYRKVNEKYGKFREYSFSGSQRYQLIPLNEFYFNTTVIFNSDEAIFLQGNYNSVIILLVVAILIFLVMLFNFINIYSSVTFSRRHEFSIKKVYGAKPWQVLSQIYLENFLQVSVAILFAWIILEFFGEISLKNISFSPLSLVRFNTIFSVILLFLIPLITTLNPFFINNLNKPLTSLQFKSKGGVSIASRAMFLVMQYVITFGLLVVAIYFMKQLNFMMSTDLGYDSNNIVVAKLLQREDTYSYADFVENRERESLMKDRIQVITENMNTSHLFSEWMFGDTDYTTAPFFPITKSGMEDYKNVGLMYMSAKKMKMFNYQLLEGRLWDSTDISQQYRFIINETAKKLFNISDIHNEYIQPEHRLWMDSQKDMSKNPAYEIVGVIKDFNTGHLSQPTVPVVIAFAEDDYYENIVAHVIPGKEQEAFNFLKNLHTELYGNADFEFTFWEDKIKELYEEDKRVSNIYNIFSVIAIIVSTLGLFALSLFDVRQRYREIALRKVHGATSANIMNLLLKKYISLLTLSFIIAVPISFLVINKLMENFAYKTSLSWWIFIIAVVFVSGISLLTLTWQVRRAMRINPADVVKSE